MTTARRKQFNESFNHEKHLKMLDSIEKEFQHTIPFRVAETPVFISKSLKKELLSSAEKIIDFIISPSFEEITSGAAPKELAKCKNIGNPTCLAIDFAIVKDHDGFHCKLIELQAALGLYGFPKMMADKFQQFYPEILGTTPYLSNLNKKSYPKLLKNVFLGNHNTKNVVFLEINPSTQQNRIDHLYLEKEVGIKTICISEIIKDGKNLCYMKDGKKTYIHRIINRVILEELRQHPGLMEHFNFEEDFDVEWVNHPIWFFKISKFIMPYLQGDNFPDCSFLNQVDLKNYAFENKVLKPVFSLGGKEVLFNVSTNDLNNIKEKSQYIVQEKVNYDFCIETPSTPVKAEIRLLYVWENGKKRPTPVITFSRFTRGNQMALRYNNDESWVGASTCFFEALENNN